MSYRKKGNITDLHTRAWENDIKWTPRCSDITGNEVTNRLAKAAEIEAQQLREETSAVSTVHYSLPARF